MIKIDEVIPSNGELGFWEYLEPEEVLNLMDNIKYGWLDSEGNYYDSLNKDNCSNYKLLEAKDIIKNGYGTCWDQVEIERFCLKNNRINIKTLFMFYEDGIDDESHTFLTYQKNNKFYWFEHAWNDYKGIYEYETFDELICDVESKFLNMIGSKYDKNKLHCFIYKKPKVGLTVDEFYEFCKSGVEVKL